MTPEQLADIEDAKTKTLHELATMGRFNLRALAQDLGVFNSEASRHAYLVMDCAGQALLLYNKLHPEEASAPIPYARQWMNEPWVKELFERQPSIMSLSELRIPGPYTYVVVVKTGDKEFVHGSLHGTEFKLNTVFYLVQDLHKKGWEDCNGNWTPGTPHESTVHYVLGRGAVSLVADEVPEPEEGMDKTTHEEYDAVVREHGLWMWTAMRTWPKIAHIEKAFNTKKSPTTFALVFRDNRHTWMKAPDIDKIRARFKRPLDARREGSMSHLRLFPEGAPQGTPGLTFTKPQLEVALVRLGIIPADEVELATAQAKKERPTAEQVAAAAEDRITKGYERRQPTRDRYAAAREELKQRLIRDGHAVDDPELAVASAMAAEDTTVDKCEPEEPTNQERLLTGLRSELKRGLPKRSTKFDARPGIDDVGLGFSSPTWED